MAYSSARIQRVLNPCRLHLQKMELELKCPACLKLFEDPMLLPCSHICCSSCIANSGEGESLCPACKEPILNKDLRAITHVETLVAIFRSMDSSFANLLHLGLPWDSLVKQPCAGAFVACKTGSEDKSPRYFAPKEPCNKVNMLSHHVSSTNPEEPYSPPSFGGNKDSDDDSNGSEHVHKLPSKISCKRTINGVGPDKTQLPLDSTPECLMHERIHSDMLCQDANHTCLDQDSADLFRELKRLKPEAKGSCDNTEFNGDKNVADDAPISNSEFDSSNKVKCSFPVPEVPSLPCAFCHSSAESEFTGPMLHYNDSGNSVDSRHALEPNISHVHEKCIHWAPQVYFTGDIAKNISGEVLRASKIKCAKCGKKGAALGCYAKSCRKSFHIPCIRQIPGCRWDEQNFLMLCPRHFSNKFPSDRSMTQNRVKSTNPFTTSNRCKLSKDPNTEGEDLWMTELDITRGWVFCGSALSSSENNLVMKFAKRIGASVSRDWEASVTHLIASTDEFGACGRTLKYLMAISSGKWILKIDWIKACLEAKHLVDEEGFEIHHDVHGCIDGPKNGRARIRDMAPPLFNGLTFYFCGHFVASYKGYLEDLIRAAGGRVLKEAGCLKNDSDSLISASYVVYNLNPPKECDLVDQASAIKMRLEEAHAIATSNGSQVAAHTWILDSIASCRLQPLVL